MIWLVFMDNGQLFGSYFVEMRAQNVAANINGVIVAMPIVMDYRTANG